LRKFDAPLTGEGEPFEPNQRERCLIAKLSEMSRSLLFVALLACSVTIFSCDEDLSDSKDIKGVWKWENTCGGIVGCRYAETGSKKAMIITADRVIMKEDAAHAEVYAYEIMMKSESDSLVSWQLRLSDGSTLTASVEKEKGQLSIAANSVIVSTYKRLR
jgi:hypothetical protein